MNCREAKAEIALWVGHDLDDDAERTLKRHVAQCPGCRRRWRTMRSIHRVLHETTQRPVDRKRESLWPQISAALQQTESPPGQHRGWVPVLAIAAALLAMVSIVNTLRYEHSLSGYLTGIDRPSVSDPRALRRVAVPSNAIRGLPGGEPFFVPDGDPFELLYERPDDLRLHERGETPSRGGRN